MSLCNQKILSLVLYYCEQVENVLREMSVDVVSKVLIFHFIVKAALNLCDDCSDAIEGFFKALGPLEKRGEHDIKRYEGEIDRVKQKGLMDSI